MTTNRELMERRKRVSPSWLVAYHDEPIAIDRGEGRYVWDVEGNRYLDFFGGILTTMVGHSIPEITAAVQEQAAKVVHTSTLYLSEPAVELAEKVTELSGIRDLGCWRSGLFVSDSSCRSRRVVANLSWQFANEGCLTREGRRGGTGAKGQLVARPQPLFRWPLALLLSP